MKLKTLLKRLSPFQKVYFGTLIFILIIVPIVGAALGLFRPEPTILGLTDDLPPSSTKVMIINYNAILENQGNQTLVDYYNWQNPLTLTNQYIADVKAASGDYVNYEVVDWQEVDDFPLKENGFDFTEDGYLECMSQRNCDGTMVDYYKILTDFDVCGLVNNLEVDELWVWGGPGFGFYESRLAGPDAFWYNSSPLTNTSCNRQLPIMGFNYERNVPEMLEDLGHRTESAMRHVYGSWEPQPTHAWNRFTLLDKNSPGNAGCGNTHFPPNGQQDYDWSNPNPVTSNCEDWLNYPNLSGATETFGCERWDCSGYNYLKWWLGHLPKTAGTTDNKLNNWWKYILNYKEATASPSPTPIPTPSPQPLQGDANQDGQVNEADYDIWLTHYLESTSKGQTVGDFNQDGLVNGLDYAIWRNNYQ